MTPRRLALPSVLVLLFVLVIPAVAMPPPEPVCTACAPAYEDAATANGAELRVAESVAVVRVHENGSATWTVGLALAGPDAEELARNGSRHEHIARNVTGERFAGTGQGSSTPLADTSALADEGESAVYYRYRDGEFARQGVDGTLVSTHFRQDLAVANYDSLGVDRLTVVAPGMALTHAPPSADVVRGLSGSAFTLTSVDQAIVTFHPDQATNPVELLWVHLASRLSIAQVLLPVVELTVGVLLLPALVIHVVMLGAVLGYLSRFGLPDAGERGRHGAVASLAVAAAVAAGQPLYAGAVALPVVGAEPSPGLFGSALGLAVVAGSVAWPERFAARLPGSGSPTRRTGSLAVTALLVAAVAGAVAGAVLPGATAWGGLGETLMVAAPTFALLPAGYAALDGRPLHGLGAASLGFLVGGFASPILYVQPQGMLFPGFIFAPFVTGAVLAVGWPLLLAGWVLEETADGTREGVLNDADRA